MFFRFLFILLVIQNTYCQEINPLIVDRNNKSLGVLNAHISDDGRFIAFSSASNNIIIGDSNFINRGPSERGNAADVFLFDRETNIYQRVSLTHNGKQIEDGESILLSASKGLDRLLYYSVGINQFPNDTRIADWDTDNDLYLYDVNTQQTSWITVSPDGVEGDSPTLIAKLNSNGRYAAVYSSSTNFLKNNDPYDSKNQIILFDLETNKRTLITKSLYGEQPIIFKPDGDLTISGDGRFVAFTTRVTNLSNYGKGGLFLWNRDTDLTELITFDIDGNPIHFEQHFLPENLALSEDGRYLFFTSRLNKHVINDPHPDEDIGVDGFIFDRISKQTKVIPLGEYDTLGRMRGVTSFKITDDGRYVLFTRHDTSRNSYELFLYDQFDDTLERLISRETHPSLFPANSIEPHDITPDGKHILFSTDALYLITRDITTSYIDDWQLLE